MENSVAIFVAICAYAIYVRFTEDYFFVNLSRKIWASIKWICTRNPLYLLLIGLGLGIALCVYGYFKSGNKVPFGLLGYPVLFFSCWTLLAYCFHKDKKGFNRALAKPFVQNYIVTIIIGIIVCVFLFLCVETPVWLLILVAFAFTGLAGAKFWWRYSESAQEFREAKERGEQIGELVGNAVNDFCEDPVGTTSGIMAALYKNKYGGVGDALLEPLEGETEIAYALRLAFGHKYLPHQEEVTECEHSLAAPLATPQQSMGSANVSAPVNEANVGVPVNDSVGYVGDTKKVSPLLIGVIGGFVAVLVCVALLYAIGKVSPAESSSDNTSAVEEGSSTQEEVGDSVSTGSEYVEYTLRGTSSIDHRHIPISITFNYCEENDEYTDCVYRNLTCTDGDGIIYLNVESEGDGTKLHMYGNDKDGEPFEVHLTRNGTSYTGNAVLDNRYYMKFSLTEQ